MPSSISRFDKSTLPRVLYLRQKYAETLAMHARYQRARKRLRHGTAAFDLLLAADPTPKAIYLTAIIHWAIAHTIRFEDARMVRRTLARFHAAKHRLPIEQRDIGQYKAPGEIDRALNSFSAAVLEVAPDIPGQEILASDQDWVLVKLTSPAAARHWAQNTRWCTHDSDIAQHYLKQGALYVLATPFFRYQFHLQSRQLMDQYDLEPEEMPIPKAAIHAAIVAINTSSADPFQDVSILTRLQWFHDSNSAPCPTGFDFAWRSQDGEWLIMTPMVEHPLNSHHCPSGLTPHIWNTKTGCLTNISLPWRDLPPAEHKVLGDLLRFLVGKALLHPEMPSFYHMTRMLPRDHLIYNLFSHDIPASIAIHGDPETSAPIALVMRGDTETDHTIIDLTIQKPAPHHIRNQAEYKALPKHLANAFALANVHDMNTIISHKFQRLFTYGIDAIDSSFWEVLGDSYRVAVLISSIQAWNPPLTRNMHIILDHFTPTEWALTDLDSYRDIFPEWLLAELERRLPPEKAAIAFSDP